MACAITVAGSESTDDTFFVDGVDDTVNGIHVEVFDELFDDSNAVVLLVHITEFTLDCVSLYG